MSPPDDVDAARRGVAEWVRSVGQATGRTLRLRGLTPAAIGASLVAAALTPIALPLVSGAAATAVTSGLVGLLGGVGSSYLFDVLQSTASRLRGEKDAAVTAEHFREALAADLRARVEHDPGLRGEMARLLTAIKVNETALGEALEGLTTQVAEEITAGLDHLGTQFREFSPVVEDMRRVLLGLHTQMAKQERRQHEQANVAWESLLRIIEVQRLLDTRARQGVARGSDIGWDSRCPYPGLHSFTMETAEWFFGRTEEIGEMLALLNRRVVDRAGPLFLVGASGCGKSSLLAAGLLPELRRGRLLVEGSTAWPVVWLVPGSHPMQALHAATAKANVVSGERCMVIVDQFEEIFTQCDDDSERRAFIAALVEWAGRGDNGGAVAPVLGAVRADFFHRCVAMPELAGLMTKDIMVLGPMREPDLRQVIVRPAISARLELEDGLVETLLRELDVRGGGYDAGALPLLAYALQRTWTEGHGRRMTLAGYHASGGIHNAVATTAEHVFGRLDADQQDAMRRVLLRLVTVEDGGEAVRRRVRADELPQTGGPEHAAIERLVEARLVTADDGAIQITHEALVRAWPRLLSWLVEDRSWLMLRRELTSAAAVWQSLGRDPGSLYRRRRLTLVSDQANLHDADLIPLEREFVRESVAMADAEADATRRRTRRLRLLVAALGLLLVISTTATVGAVVQRRAADLNSRIATASSLAAQSRAVVASQPDLANLLALAGLDHAVTTQTIASAQAALSTPMHTARPLIGHRGSVTTVAFSSDGQVIATGSDDGTVRLWNAGTNQTLATITGHGGPVSAVAFSPDGRSIATGGAATTRLWDTTTSRLLATFTAHGEVSTMAFSPDGTTLATGGADGTARLWSISTHGPVATFPDHDGPVFAVSFSPDGRTIATGGDDNTARLWDTKTHQAIATLRGHTGEVFAVAFDRTGKTLSTGSADGTARLWDTSTHQETATLAGHTRVVHAVAFGPDGRMATGSWDGTVRLWSTSTRQTIATLTGHSDHVLAAAMHPEGTALVTGSKDGTARLWETSTRQSIATLTGHTGYVDTVAFSPDRRTIATGSRDGTARLWDLADRRTTAILAGDAGFVFSVAFSPDGRLLATGHKDGSARLWDINTKQQIARLNDHADGVAVVAFNPDGTTLVSASTDGNARLWDLSTRQTVAILSGHTGWVVAAAFSPDNSIVATASTDGTARLWDMRTHATIATLSHTDIMTALAFSPDGKLLATAPTDGTARLWDLATRQVVNVLTGHTDGVTSIAFSPDGRTVATGSKDGTARLWDTNGRTLLSLPGHNGWVTAVAFSTDAKTLATGSWDHTARLTPTPATWAAELCHRAGRNLTLNEWTFYVGGEPYRRLCADLPPGQGADPSAPAIPAPNLS